MRKDLSLTVFWLYNLKYCSIKKLIGKYKRIPWKKKRENGDLWLYNKDVNNAIKRFTKA